MSGRSRRVLFAVSGWYGMGHLEPMFPVAEALVRHHGCEVSLLTTRFEFERLERQHRSALFHRHFLLEEQVGPVGLDEYLRQSNPVNRLRLAHAVEESDPGAVVFHWSLLLPIADRVALAGRCTVAMMERSEWGSIELGRADEYGAIDKVIYADEWMLGEQRAAEDADRICVGPLARRPGTPPAGDSTEPTVFVGGGGGARSGNRRLLAALPALAGLVEDLTFEVVVGPMTPPELANVLVEASAIAPNLRVHVDPARRLIEALLDGASVALNNGGIGSTGECLVRGIPFVALDVAGNDDENDRVRIVELQRSGWCRMVESGGEVPVAEALAAALREVGATWRPAPVASGIDAAAAAIARWAADPEPRFAAALQRVVLIVPAWASAELERAIADELDQPTTRLVVVRLPVTVTIDEQSRLQREVLVGRAYASARVLGLCIRSGDRELLESLECPAPIEVIDAATPDLGRTMEALRHLIATPSSSINDAVVPLTESFERLVQPEFNPFKTGR